MTLLFCTVAPLLADDAPAPRAITVEECLTRAAARRPELLAGAARTAAAAFRARQAGRRLNPRLEAEIENIAGTDGLEGFRGAESTLSLAQEIELGGQRRHRTAAAEAVTAVRRADEAVLRHELLFETRRAALAVLAAQAQVRLAEDLLALAREAEKVAAAREQAGKATVLESERARAETAAAALEVAERQAEQRDAVYELARVIGESEPSFDQVSGTLDAPPPALPALDALLLQAAAHPALLAAEAETRALETLARSEEAARRPNLELAAGLRRFEEPDGYGLVAGIGIELPLVNRNTDAVRAAEAEAQAAGLQTAAARLRNESALRRLYARLHALVAKDAQLRDTVLPAAERALAWVRQAHEQGKAGYLEVLEARRALAHTRRARLDAAADYQTCRIELEERAGAAAPDTRNP